MNEQETRKSQEQPFRHHAKVTTGRWGIFHGFPEAEMTWGDKWEIILYLDQSDRDPAKRFPQEIFDIMNWHMLKDPDEGYIGFVRGTETPNVLFIAEMQSDLMQNTFKFSEKEPYLKRLMDRLAQLEAEKGLVPPESQVPGEDKMLDAEIERIKSKVKETMKPEHAYQEFHPEFASYRSSLETLLAGKHKSLPKRWIRAFFNAAYDYGRERDMTFVMMPSAQKVREVWAKTGYLLGTGGPLFDRIYDRGAAAFGMQHLQQGQLDGISKGLHGAGRLQSEDWWAGMLKDTFTASSGEEVPVPDEYKVKRFEHHIDSFVADLLEGEDA